MPVGATKLTWGGNDKGSSDWFDAALSSAGGTAPVRYDDADGAPIEDIAALAPDLILATNSGITKEDYDKLVKIAPVVAYPEGPWITPWRTSLETIGTAVGRPEKAAEVAAATEQLITDTTAANANLKGTSTALPAIARIVADLPRDARGAAYLEVPTAEDELPLTPPEGLAVRWISRADRPHGEALQRAVRRHVALPPLDASPAPSASEPASSMDVEIWETPTFSAYGESLEEATVPHTDHQGMYAWVAGESSIVKAVRRALVGELGLDRRQLAFMGYWRQGVAMRS